MSYLDESLAPGETIVARFPLHWTAKWRLIVFLLLAIPTLGIALLAALYEWIRLRSIEMGVTNRRVVRKTGIVSRETEELRLASIETIDLRQSAWRPHARLRRRRADRSRRKRNDLRRASPRRSKPSARSKVRTRRMSKMRRAGAARDEASVGRGASRDSWSSRPTLSTLHDLSTGFSPPHAAQTHRLGFSPPHAAQYAA